MKNRILVISILLIGAIACIDAQDDSTATQVEKFQLLLKQLQKNRLDDSLKKVELQNKYDLLKTNQVFEKDRVRAEFKTIEIKDSLRKADMIARANYLRKNAIGYPVTLFSDTLFKLYTRIGASTPKDRARNISARIKRLYDDDFFRPDSLVILNSENTQDIAYGDMIVLSISDLDALINNTTRELLSKNYAEKIISAINAGKSRTSVVKILLRIGLMLLVITSIGLLIWLIGKGHIKTADFITARKEKWLKSLSYKDYTFLSADQELKLIYFVLKLMRWFFIIILLYLVLPIVFSIFPFTRGWANMLFNLVWSPFKSVLISIWDFMPNLFSILVIYSCDEICNKAC